MNGRSTVADLRFTTIVAAAIAIAGITGILYWRTVSQPFVYDDWLFLYPIHTGGATGAIRDAFLRFDGLTYRPLAMMYYTFVYKTFGVDATGSHIIALILHACNGCLVMYIVANVTAMKPLAVTVGMIYTASASIHLDPLLWLVGFYDVGGMLFVLASLAFFLAKRNSMSVAFFVLALLTKEATVFLVIVLTSYVLLFDPSPLKRLRPFALVIFLYIIVKLSGMSPFQVDPSHPHRMDIAGSHVLFNLSSYSRWLAESLFPSLRIPGVALAGMITMLVLGAVLQGVRLREPLTSAEKKQIVFFGVWMMAAILSVILLRNQAARYYATYSLVPFLILLVMMIGRIVPPSRTVYRTILFSTMVIAVILSNVIYVERLFTQERRGAATTDGTFHLIQKAGELNRFHGALLVRHPTLPPHTTIVLSGMSLIPSGNGIAARLWYNDTTLNVITLTEYCRLKEALPPDSTLAGEFVFVDCEENEDLLVP